MLVVSVSFRVAAHFFFSHDLNAASKHECSQVPQLFPMAEVETYFFRYPVLSAD